MFDIYQYVQSLSLSLSFFKFVYKCVIQSCVQRGDPPQRESQGHVVFRLAIKRLGAREATLFQEAHCTADKTVISMETM